jgi:hypothetical protein
LGLLQIDEWVDLGNPGSQARTVFEYVLNQYGFSDEEAESATATLSQAGAVIHREYGGKLQRYLRRHAKAMRDDLTQAFGNDALAKPKLQYAITHWLQNAFGLPISLQSEAVAEFCKEEDVTIEQLWQAADQLDINLAIVDDVLEIEQEANLAATQQEMHRHERMGG